jgi:uncharacterized protein (TIGR00369 family)
LQAQLDSSPLIKFFGMRVLRSDVAESTDTIAMELRPELERVAGTGQWHGGALASLIDVAGDMALVLSVEQPVPTINLRVDYLRPAATATLTATSRVRRAGRTVGVVDIDVLDAEGRLVAIGRGTYGTQPG